MDDNEVYKKKKGFQKYGDLIIWKENIDIPESTTFFEWVGNLE